MGLEFSEGNHIIKQYGKSEKAELKLDSAVGLSRQEDGTWAMVGDFYHSGNPKLNKYYNNTGQFSKELAKNYAVEEAFSNLEEHNFFCSDNSEAEVSEDGLIRITFENLG